LNHISPHLPDFYVERTTLALVRPAAHCRIGCQRTDYRYEIPRLFEGAERLLRIMLSGSGRAAVDLRSASVVMRQSGGPTAAAAISRILRGALF